MFFVKLVQEPPPKVEVKTLFPGTSLVDLRVKDFLLFVHCCAVLGAHAEDGVLSSLEAVVSTCTVVISLRDEKPFWSHLSFEESSYTLQVIRGVIWILHLQRSSKSFSCETWALLNYIEFCPVDPLVHSLSLLMEPAVVWSFESMHCV